MRTVKESSKGSRLKKVARVDVFRILNVWKKRLADYELLYMNSEPKVLQNMF